MGETVEGKEGHLVVCQLDHLLAHGPVMVYNPAAEHTYEGPLPDARGTEVHARGAKPAITKISGKKAVDAKKEAVDAPITATNFRTRNGSMQA